MKKYNKFQRIFNIINRAVEEYDLQIDGQKSLDAIYAEACETIEQYSNYDYISECELSNHHQCLSWSDEMGFDVDASGEFINARKADNSWYRKQDDGTFVEINWYDADEDNDYVACYDVIDSKGQRVILVCKK